MRNFKNYRVWDQAMALVRNIYNISSCLPKEEMYGLKSQIRRSAVSIPSNIAEGSARRSDKEFRRFIEVALGSSFELETQLILAQDLFKISGENFENEVESLWELQRGLNALWKSLGRKVG